MGHHGLTDGDDNGSSDDSGGGICGIIIDPLRQKLEICSKFDYRYPNEMKGSGMQKEKQRFYARINLVV